MIGALESLAVIRRTHIGQWHTLKHLTTDLEIYDGVSKPEGLR